MEKHNTVLQSHGQLMTDKQIRDVVTPYEFGVSDNIIGTRLARPFRRGRALLVDLFLVVMLTHLPSILLALVAVIFFWRAGKKNGASPRFGWSRKIMKAIAAFLLFGILIAFFDGINKPDGPDTETDVNTPEGPQAIVIVSILLSMPSEVEQLEDDIAQQRCEAYNCWQDYLMDITDDIDDVRLPSDAAAELADNLRLAMQRSLSAEQIQTLLNPFKNSLQSIEALPSENALSQAIEAPSSETDTAEFMSKFNVPVNENGTPSLLAWFRGLLEDLGVGFGWAAFYFTVVTCWMNGQTPGKWLFGLKVIKLDGTPMTMWQSFGRYGGYGAGFATGLLGFAQIFWEPNRQAIQDKISETLVIRLGMDKIDVQEIYKYRQQGMGKTDKHHD